MPMPLSTTSTIKWFENDVSPGDTVSVKKRLKIELSLYTILQIYSVSVFEKIPILQVLTDDAYKNLITSGPIHLKSLDS